MAVWYPLHAVLEPSTHYCWQCSRLSVLGIMAAAQTLAILSPAAWTPPGAPQKCHTTGPLSPQPTEWDSALSQDCRGLRAQGRAQTRGGEQAPTGHPGGRLPSRVTQSDALVLGANTSSSDQL